MSLDQNLFTLHIRRSEHEPQAIDMVDPQGIVHYRKRMYQPPASSPTSSPGDVSPSAVDSSIKPIYEVYDAHSDGLLATLRANPVTANKKRMIELHNPSALVDLNFTGSMSFKWQFDWETHSFEFKKGECRLLRRPDPPVLVAVWQLDKKRGAESQTLGSFQVMDYNLTRFDIDDRKGLEIVMVTGLLSFQDGALNADQGGNGGPPVISGRSNTVGGSQPGGIGGPAALGPAEIRKEIAYMQKQEKTEPNEIMVTAQFSIPEFADYAANMLADENMMFIVIRSKGESEVSKVVAVAEECKRMRHRSGAYDEELHQYVKYDEDKASGNKGPRVIKLDDRPSNPSNKDISYRPPTTLTIHLSKIPMPELQPKAKPSVSAATALSGSNANLRPNRGNPSTRPVSMLSTPTPSTKPNPKAHRRASPSPPRSFPKPNNGPPIPQASSGGGRHQSTSLTPQVRPPVQIGPRFPSPQSPPIPGSYPNSYFPASPSIAPLNSQAPPGYTQHSIAPPPGPPPAQMHGHGQQGSSSGMTAMLSGLLPSSNGTNSGGGSVRDAASMVGTVGMNLFGKFSQPRK